MGFTVIETTIADYHEALRTGAVKVSQVVDAYLARIDAFDQQGPRLNSIITVNPRARDEAAELDAAMAAGLWRGSLHGVPVILKDNADTAGLPTTSGPHLPHRA